MDVSVPHVSEGGHEDAELLAQGLSNREIAAAMYVGEATAKTHGATEVHRVRVQIGEAAGVERELLKTAFDTFRERTICDGAELTINTVAPAANGP